MAVRSVWLVGKGWIHIYFTLEDRLGRLRCNKAVRLFKKLDAAHSIGLIEQCKGSALKTLLCHKAWNILGAS